jgi:hypothetical protein
LASADQLNPECRWEYDAGEGRPDVYIRAIRRIIEETKCLLPGAYGIEEINVSGQSEFTYIQKGIDPLENKPVARIVGIGTIDERDIPGSCEECDSEAAGAADKLPDVPQADDGASLNGKVTPPASEAPESQQRLTDFEKLRIWNESTFNTERITQATTGTVAVAIYSLRKEKATQNRRRLI